MNRSNWPRFVSVTLFLSLLLAVSSLAIAAQTYTIRGKITYPDGRPAPGIEVMLVAWSTQGLDQNNLLYKIPGYDKHVVTSDANGDYVMTGVVDYPQNPTHRYCVYVTSKITQYHGSMSFPLRPEIHDIVGANVNLEPATILTVSLKDRSGRPFEGTRAVFLQTGRNLSNPTTGYTSVREIKFVNGVGSVKLVIRDPANPVGRIALLDFPSQAVAKPMMWARGLSTADNSLDGLRFTTKNAKGQAQDKSVQLVPLGEVKVEFSL